MKHKLKGVCAKEVKFTVAGGKLKNVEFLNGCAGNLKALGVLLEGMRVEDVISKLKGITCGKNPTSCSDQLAKVLKKIKKPAK
ncbi:MAG: TIGR03905 family protein [Elusimicrobia bacterium GWA2_61_42]|nr:MAG: TIGR03905 family protein [Elusimicrobia bacterium GWA2_61_42]OGR75248.1 MAG: TIGR03905 family protein [Elusimicrobia bacterium GWC2_61_25]